MEGWSSRVRYHLVVCSVLLSTTCTLTQTQQAQGGPCGVSLPCPPKQKYPDPEDCNKFYVCSQEGSDFRSKTCPPGKHFHAHILKCRPFGKAECSLPCVLLDNSNPKLATNEETMDTPEKDTDMGNGDTGVDNADVDDLSMKGNDETDRNMEDKDLGSEKTDTNDMNLENDDSGRDDIDTKDLNMKNIDKEEEEFGNGSGSEDPNILPGDKRDGQATPNKMDNQDIIPLFSEKELTTQDLRNISQGSVITEGPMGKSNGEDNISKEIQETTAKLKVTSTVTSSPSPTSSLSTSITTKTMKPTEVEVHVPSISKQPPYHVITEDTPLTSTHESILGPEPAASGMSPKTIGIIAGSATGAAIILVLIIAVICIIRRKRLHRKEQIPTVENPMYRKEKSAPTARGYRFSRDASVYISPRGKLDNNNKGNNSPIYKKKHPAPPVPRGKRKKAPPPPNPFGDYAEEEEYGYKGGDSDLYEKDTNGSVDNVEMTTFGNQVTSVVNDEFDDRSFDEEAMSDPLLDEDDENNRPNGRLEHQRSTDYSESDSSDEPHTEDELENVSSAIDEALKDKNHSAEGHGLMNGDAEQDEEDDEYDKSHNPFFADEEDTY